METQSDFRELLALFNAHRVEYVIVGGQAMAAHGAPRFTGDMDLYVRPAPANAKAVMAALAAFGFGDVGLREDDFAMPGRVIQLGVPPVRVDIVTSIEGVGWDAVWAGRVTSDYGGVPVAYIGRPELLANKRAVGRPRDLMDIELLGERES